MTSYSHSFKPILFPGKPYSLITRMQCPTISHFCMLFLHLKLYPFFSMSRSHGSFCTSKMCSLSTLSISWLEPWSHSALCQQPFLCMLVFPLEIPSTWNSLGVEITSCSYISNNTHSTFCKVDYYMWNPSLTAEFKGKEDNHIPLQSVLRSQAQTPNPRTHRSLGSWINISHKFLEEEEPPPRPSQFSQVLATRQSFWSPQV